MPASVLFLTTTNFATNPRLTKEVRTCIALGHKVTVLSFQFSNWSKGINDRLLEEFKEKVQLVILTGDRQNKFFWLASTFAQLLAGTLLRIWPHNIYLLSLHSSKRSFLLFWALKRKLPIYDVVIAHNPGAFVPAYHYAKKMRIKLGIDVEDYHPGESDDSTASKRIEMMMSAILSHADVITAASPLILENSLNFDLENKSRKAVINNVFSLRQQPEFNEPASKPLKLIWFSQTIGLNRGIQDVIIAMNAVEDFPVKLTILGNCPPGVKHKLLSLLTSKCHEIHFLAPVHENELMEICSQHHIGLALEPSIPLNRDICLTNKLFTYLLAGNAILASETSAQKKLLKENPGIGKTYPVGNIKILKQCLYDFEENVHELSAARKQAYHLAKSKLNWEEESKIFVGLYGLSEEEKKNNYASTQ